MGKLLDRPNFEAAYIGFDTTFNDALRDADPVYPEISTVLRSDSPIEHYKWLGQVPTMKKWLGQRTVNKLTAESKTIANDDYANGIEVERDDLRDDRLGLVKPRIQDLAKMALRKMDAAVVGKITAGFGSTELTYDGQNLFSASHTAKGNGTGTAQSNTATAALSVASMQTGYEAMMGFLDENDEPLDIEATTLLVGPANWDNARTITKQEFLSSGESNKNNGLLKVVVSKRITDGAWFMLDTSQSVRAVLLQIRQDPEFRALDDMDAYQAFMSKTFMYGADCTFGAGLGMWQTIYGSTGAG